RGMASRQSLRHGELRELRRALVGHETIGQHESVAERAIERRAELRSATRLALDPGAAHERRLVANMLAMSTVEQRNPVLLLIPNEAADSTLHLPYTRARTSF